MAESTASGPISSTRTASRASTASVNRTVARTCLTQYSGSVTSAPTSTDETNSTVGGWKAIPARAWRKSSSIGSMSAEWNAWATLSRLVRSNRAASASTTSSGPEMTTDRGPLIAAMSTPGEISCGAASTATIAPPDGSARMSDPRARSSAQASSSESTPATCAAAISPMECPATTSGVTPNDCGEPVEGDLHGEDRGLGGATHLREVRADLVEGGGEDGELPVELRPHVLPLRPLAGEEEGGPAPPGLPGLDRAETVQELLAGAHHDAAPLHRGAARERERDVGGVLVGDEGPQPVGLRLEVALGAGGQDPGHHPVGRVRADGAAGSGACSMMVWALVPLMPNDETAARRGLPVSGHARSSVRRATRPVVQSTIGVGSSTCRVAGSTPARMAMTILMIPPTPAAAWVWPRFDLREPSHSGSSRSWP